MPDDDLVFLSVQQEGVVQELSFFSNSLLVEVMIALVDLWHPGC